MAVFRYGKGKLLIFLHKKVENYFLLRSCWQKTEWSQVEPRDRCVTEQHGENDQRILEQSCAISFVCLGKEMIRTCCLREIQLP